MADIILTFFAVFVGLVLAVGILGIAFVGSAVLADVVEGKFGNTAGSIIRTCFILGASSVFITALIIVGGA